jgi:hypothetical protein
MRRVLSGVLGVAVISIAVFIVPGARDTLATALMVVGFALVCVCCGLPIVTAADTGHPIGRLVAGFGDRQRAMVDRIHGTLDHTLQGIAGDIVLDAGRARQLVEETIEQAAAAWRGPVTSDLDRYLQCALVSRALMDPWSDPAIAPDDPRSALASVSRWRRVIVSLRRIGMVNEEICAVLGCTVADLDGDRPPISSGS